MIKKNKCKLITSLILIALLIIGIVFTIKSNTDLLTVFENSEKKYYSNNSESDVKKAIQEVMKAYYKRGTYSQYCSYRRSWVNPPESATSQHTCYTVCSNFAFNIYYEALGVEVPSITQLINQYARQYYVKDINNINNSDVIEYWERTIDGSVVTYDNNYNNLNDKNINLSTTAGQQAYGSMLLNDYKLQVGDILCSGNKNGGAGHTMVVYEIEYDENNNPVDAILMDAESKGDDNKTTKITAEELLFRKVNNNGFDEGVIRKRRLTKKEGEINSLVFLLSPSASSPRTSFTILRPLLRNSNGTLLKDNDNNLQYYKGTYDSVETNNNHDTGYLYTERVQTDCSLTDGSEVRIAYPDLYIEKTVDVFNNSVVDLGDTLTYTIKVNNESQEDYNRLEIIEEIGEGVEVIDYSGTNVVLQGNKIIWTENILAGKRRERYYTVRVNEDYSLLGHEIVSNGTVAKMVKDNNNNWVIDKELSTGTIKNMIANNLSATEKTNIKNNLQSLLTSTNKPKGVTLIDTLYGNLGYDFKLGADTANNIEEFNITDLIKTRSKHVYNPTSLGVYLNQGNENYGIVLNNYYSALYNSGTKFSLKRFEAYSFLGSRDKRADTLYMENFETGDVLVYKNTQTANSDTDYITEDGTYYLVFISEEDKITINGNDIYGFVGVKSNGEINRIYRDEGDYKAYKDNDGKIYYDYTITDLRTLLGKDYYVILRPSLGFDITPPNVTVTYSTEELTEESVIVTVTADEEVQDVSGWTKLSDGKTLTKEYTENVDEDITIKDLVGNEKIVNIKIENIGTEIKGDLNDNAQIDIGDLLVIYRYLAYNNNTEVAQNHPEWNLTTEKMIQGDLNNNNLIDIGDSLKIQRYIAASNSEEVALKHPNWLDIQN